MNPYHEPETAAAIRNTARCAAISIETREILLGLIRTASPPGNLIKPVAVRRSIEIVLSRVKMHEAMRRDLMRALGHARATEVNN